MFSNESNIESLQDLLKEVKKYIDLQKEYIRLNLVEKLTILISTLLLILILSVLGLIALFFLSFALVHVLEPYVGGITNSYMVISSSIIVLILLITFFRKKLIVKPLVNFLANLLLNDE